MISLLVNGNIKKVLDRDNRYIGVAVREMANKERVVLVKVGTNPVETDMQD